MKIIKGKTILSVSLCDEDKNAVNLCGIGLNDSYILLENGLIVDMDNHNLRSVEISENAKDVISYPLSSSRYNIVLNIGHARGVSVETKQTLKQLYDGYRELAKNASMFCMARMTFEGSRAKFRRLTTFANEKQGLLSLEEFANEFEANLSDEIYAETKKIACEKKDFYGNCVPFETIAYKDRIEIRRTVCACKTSDEIFDLERSETGRNYLSEYGVELAVKHDCDKRLFIGQGNAVFCSVTYTIPIEKALTKQYAKELADSFCER